MSPWLVGGLTLLGTLGGAVAAWLTHRLRCATTTTVLYGHRWWRVESPGKHGLAMEGDCVDHPAVIYRCAEPANHQALCRCRCGATRPEGEQR
ncbi:MAG TPA: hypothetical protein VGW74_13130 [Propionibacteriaceae bacterium]|nr:hypothetical protein [Propionibacteriaceae bacterium]